MPRSDGFAEVGRVRPGPPGKLPVTTEGTDAMHIDPYIVLGSAVVGLLVGLTGAGGGALMTPMLILLFGITPSPRSPATWSPPC